MTVSTLTPAPFKPSLLRFSSSPSSPLPVGTATYHPSSSLDPACKAPKCSRAAPPPYSPLPWLWTCHHCHRTYKLSVTVRCLEEGHFFCTGTTSVAGGKHTARRSCNSEFDYSGWAAMHEWRRQAAGLESEKDSSRNCWLYCDYPSECRWGERITKAKEKRSKLATIKEIITEAPHPDVTVEPRRDAGDESLTQRIAVAIKVAAAASVTPPKELDLSLLLKRAANSCASAPAEIPPRPSSPLKQHYQLPELPPFPQLEPVTIFTAGLGSDKPLGASVAA